MTKIQDEFTDIQLNDLNRSGIISEIAKKSGWYPDDDEELGNHLCIPYYKNGDISTKPILTRLKPDKQMGSEKYIQREDTKTRIYIPPLIDKEKLLDTNTPLILTEGEKKAVCGAVNGLVVLAAPGVWNFHERDENFCFHLKDCFDDIPIKNRKIYILFDILEFEKSDVLRAKLALAEMLRKAGANVQVCHFSDCKNANKHSNDIGLDDYLVEFGIEEFKKNILENAWPYPFPKDVWKDKIYQNAEMRLLKYYSVSNSPDFKFEITRVLKSEYGISFSHADKFKKEYLATTFKPKVENKDSSNILVHWDSKESVEDRHKVLTKALKSINAAYRVGTDPVEIDYKNHTYRILGHLDDFCGFINGNIEFYRYRHKAKVYDGVNKADMSIYKKTYKQIITFNEIKHISDVPVYNKNFELLKPGYNHTDRVMITGKKITPSFEKKYINLFLNEAHYAKDGSRENRLGSILTMFFPWLSGEKPMVSYRGNKPGIGKTIATECDSIIRTGTSPKQVSFNPNDEEFEKQLGATIDGGVYDILIDNARADGRSKVIKSLILERSITSKNLQFRILGRSSRIEVPNTNQISITANNSNLNQDLVSRSITVNMFYDGDPDEHVYKIRDPKDFAYANRKKIIAELLGMIETWVKAGKPLAQRKKFRFTKFAEVIGGILEVNDYKGFLSNYQSTKRLYSAEYDQLNDMFSLKPDLCGKPKLFADFAKSNNLMGGIFAYKTLSTSSFRKMSSILGNHLNEDFKLEDGRVGKLVREENKKEKAFIWFLEFGGEKLQKTEKNTPLEKTIFSELRHRISSNNKDVTSFSEDREDSPQSYIESNKYTDNIYLYNSAREVSKISPLKVEKDPSNSDIYEATGERMMEETIPANVYGKKMPYTKPFVMKFENKKYHVLPWKKSLGKIGDLVAFDTETEMAVDGIIPRFVIGQAYAGNEIYMIHKPDLLDFLEAHKKSELVMHNAKFDIQVCEQETGFDFDPQVRCLSGKLWDTGLLYRLNQLATVGITGKWSLAHLSKDLLNIELDKSELLRCDFGRFINDDKTISYQDITTEQLEYASRDAVVTFQCLCILKQKVSDLDPKGSLSHAIQLMGSIGLGAIEQNGIGFDLEAKKEILEMVDADLSQYQEKMAEYGYIPGQKGNDTVMKSVIQKVADENNLELPRTRKTNKIKVDQKVLMKLQGKSDFVEALLNYRKEKKFADFIRELEDSRVHPRFNTLVTTGRTSCHSPNIQNLPRKPGVRECFIPAKGKHFLITDYNQLELATLAQTCLDRYGHSKMADLINEGVDLHRWFASVVLNKPTEEITKSERQMAKACNFGFPGGLGAANFLNYARDTYGIKGITLQEATKYRDQWLSAFPEMEKYLEDQIAERLKPGYNFENAKDTLGDFFTPTIAAKIFMRIIGGATSNSREMPYQVYQLRWAFEEVLPSLLPEIESDIKGSQELKDQIQKKYPIHVKLKTGRIRTNCGYNDSKNTPFQGLAADGAKIALYALHRAGFRVVNFIHDEFIIEVDDTLEKTAEHIKRIVVDSMRIVTPDVAIRTEHFFSNKWTKDG